MQGVITEYKLESLPEVTAVYGRGINHSFPRHSHASYTAGAVLRGRRKITAGNTECVYNPGQVFEIMPLQEHFCESLSSNGHDYLALSLTPAAYMECIGRGIDFSVIFMELFDRIGRDKFSESLVAEVIQGVSGLRPENYTETELPEAIDMGYDFIGENYSLKLSLADIAAYSCMSKYNFQRNFTSYIGMSPAALQGKYRVASALLRLRQGQRASSVALDCGFSDQSHLCRMVKKLTGVTIRNYHYAAAEADPADSISSQ